MLAPLSRTNSAVEPAGLPRRPGRAASKRLNSRRYEPSNIAIPDKDPNSWRNRGWKWKQPQDMPTIIEGVKSPQQIARDKRIRRLRELTA
jgi:hypothetical protein